MPVAWRLLDQERLVGVAAWPRIASSLLGLQKSEEVVNIFSLVFLIFIIY